MCFDVSRVIIYPPFNGTLAKILTYLRIYSQHAFYIALLQSHRYVSTARWGCLAWRNTSSRIFPANWKRIRRKYRSPGNLIIQWKRWIYLRQKSPATVHTRQSRTNRLTTWITALFFAGAATTRAVSWSRVSSTLCQLVSTSSTSYLSFLEKLKRTLFLFALFFLWQRIYRCDVISLRRLYCDTLKMML